MDKQRGLNTIAKEIEHCTICKEGKTGLAVPGEGNPDADIVFIGEAPGKTEAKTGRPFVGRSGQLLRSLIREIGLEEKDVYITSPVKYLPLKVTPTPKDIAHGRTHLMKQLEVIQPKVVILLGRVAAEGVLQNPTSVASGDLRGVRKVAVTKERGNVIEERDGVKYFLTYHPAAALRFPVKFKRILEEDFEKVKKFIYN
ncbi:MAG: uracil-DNA glycosylase [Candidatus Levybacteria bacterium]|nr:uracil-DNA glycosylase [Candidatus Levybacteria bacterium]